MATPLSVPTTASEQSAIPPALLMVCFALFVINATFFPAAFFAHGWIFDDKGLGIPTDFVNVWSAGRLVLEGHAAQAYDWDIQKQVQVAVLGQGYPGNFAWHYPPPFLFVATLLAHFPYAVAFMGWAVASLVPYLAVMRAIVGRPFGLLLAAAFPVVLTNTLVGQNGFLTASLIGGTLYLMPVRPVLAGICLGLLSYKPQYGLLFPLVLIAASQWTVFVTAAIVAVAMALLSWFAFGSESWQAFFHWMPMFSQAFLTEGRAPWGKMQSVFALVRYFGGAEQLAWVFQWIMSGTVAVRAGTDVAQPYQLFAEGRSARRRHVADHAVSVSLRSHGAGDRGGVPGPDRIEAGLSAPRIASARSGRTASDVLSAGWRSDRLCRDACRHRIDRGSLRAVAQQRGVAASIHRIGLSDGRFCPAVP